MPLTDNLRLVSKYIFDQINASKDTLGLLDVFYGDQVKIPRAPTVCVESNTKARELDGVPRATRVNLSTYILVYHADLTQSIQTTRAEAEDLSETIETFLHDASRYTMGDLVIHHMVTDVEYGYATRGGRLFQATRMQDVAISKVLLPSPSF